MPYSNLRPIDFCHFIKCSKTWFLIGWELCYFRTTRAMKKQKAFRAKTWVSPFTHGGDDKWLVRYSHKSENIYLNDQLRKGLQQTWKLFQPLLYICNNRIWRQSKCTHWLINSQMNCRKRKGQWYIVRQRGRKTKY